jgi:hypothetical protein
MIDFGHLLDCGGERDVVEPGTAVLDWNDTPEKAEIAKLAHNVSVEDFIAISVDNSRRDRVVRDLPHKIDQHGGLALTRTWRSAVASRSRKIERKPKPVGID